MLLNASGGTRSRAAAARMPSANSSSWTMPYPTRDTPATIAPAAISESPVTRIAPGSRMASGGSRVRRAPSTIPAEAAVNTRQATRKAATLGSSVASASAPGTEPGQTQHDHRADRRQRHVHRTGLQDQPDPDRGDHPGERGQPGRVALGSTPQRGQPRQRLAPVDHTGHQLATDQPDLGRLVEPQRAVHRLHGGRFAAAQREAHPGGSGGHLQVGVAQSSTDRIEVLVDLVHGLPGGHHRDRQVGEQQPVPAACRPARAVGRRRWRDLGHGLTLSGLVRSLLPSSAGARDPERDAARGPGGGRRVAGAPRSAVRLPGRRGRGRVRGARGAGAGAVRRAAAGRLRARAAGQQRQRSGAESAVQGHLRRAGAHPRDRRPGPRRRRPLRGLLRRRAPAGDPAPARRDGEGRAGSAASVARARPDGPRGARRPTRPVRACWTRCAPVAARGRTGR